MPQTRVQLLFSAMVAIAIGLIVAAVASIGFQVRPCCAATRTLLWVHTAVPMFRKGKGSVIQSLPSSCQQA